MDKYHIRSTMINLRGILSSQEVQSSSKIITEKISRMDSFKKAKKVLFYFPFKNEVNVIPLIVESFADKTVCLPRSEKEKRIMTARKVVDFEGFAEDKYGIFSPPEATEIVSPAEIDFIVVPLVAFDGEMNRIGYGSGYYDTYLPKCINAFKCAVAYSFQRNDEFKSEIHDVKMDIVVTETDNLTI